MGYNRTGLVEGLAGQTHLQHVNDDEKRLSAYTAISGPDTWASSPMAISTLVIKGQLVNIGVEGVLQMSEVRALNSVTGIQLQYATHTPHPLLLLTLQFGNEDPKWNTDVCAKQTAYHMLP